MVYDTLYMKLNSFVIFRQLLDTPVMRSLSELLACDTADTAAAIKTYSTFAAELLAEGGSLPKHIWRLLQQDENLYMKALYNKNENFTTLTDCLENELAILDELAAFDGIRIREAIDYPGFLPTWESGIGNFTVKYKEHLAKISTEGYGIFARSHVFTVDQAGRLVPVKYPDPQSLAALHGYEKEREKVIANTRALLEGKPANNVLLYGDAGTGKSSTVKAVANAYKEQGLRLIEVKKNQLYQIPDLVDSLGNNPLKFILFIDDLSFSTNDSDFAALKAILEGSVNARGNNLAVYATSNRRHLIKEDMTDREGTDLHLSDTMQELMSLSARFGLTITFSRPNKDLYCEIVCKLAAQYGVQMAEDALIQKAEAHAIRCGGRSPRLAKQFIELLKSGVI